MDNTNGSTQEKMLEELYEIRKDFFLNKSVQGVSIDWIPRRQVMQFFNYGDTQMAALEKNEKLVVSKIGNRKFYHRESLARLLDEHKLSN